MLILFLLYLCWCYTIKKILFQKILKFFASFCLETRNYRDTHGLEYILKLITCFSNSSAANILMLKEVYQLCPFKKPIRKNLMETNLVITMIMQLVCIEESDVSECWIVVNLPLLWYHVKYCFSKEIHKDQTSHT